MTLHPIKSSFILLALKAWLMSPSRTTIIMKKLAVLGLLIALALPSSGVETRAQGAAQRPPAAAPTPVELGKFSAWTAYAIQAAQGRECYLVGSPQASLPKDIQPGTARRDPTMLFIAHRPAQNVRNELFVTLGYAIKDKSNTMVEVIGTTGTRRFMMFSKQQGAWLLNAAEETQFVDLVRKSREIKVHAMSQRGTMTVDTYALSGIAGALDRISKDCK